MLITEEWLKDNQFKLTDFEQRHRSRRLSNDLHLSLDYSEHMKAWHCWLVWENPYRHIHIRYLTEIDEVISLCEALSGKPWDFSTDDLESAVKEVFQIELDVRRRLC
jgi:hypothetical protein